MALTPEQIAGFAAAAEEIAQPVIEWLLRDIARRVAEAGRMTSTAAYEAYRASALGESRRALAAFLQRQLKLSEREAAFLLEEAARFAQADDYARVGVWATEADGASLARLAGAAVRQAGIELQNLTGTLGMTSPRTGRPQPLQRTYRACMDEALKLVSTGAASASEAARQATRSLAGRGVVSIDYASGVSTELGAAVRRNLMGGMGQLVEQVTRMDHDALGCDGWEISAHANSAPDHEPIQGRQYTDAEYEQLNGSLARRIGTLNCGHVAMPVILGVDSPQYTEAELAAFQEENARGVVWEGRRMTGYEATQYQNRLERSIRTQKHRALLSEAAGDEEQLLHDRVRLARLHQEYARFNQAMGFKSRTERLEAVGWGRRQVRQDDLVAKTAESGIMKAQEKFVFSPASDIEEAKQFALKTLNLENVDYRNFDISVANMVNREIIRFYNAFGDLHEKGALRIVMTYPKKRDAYASYQPAYGAVYMKNVKSKNALSNMLKEAREQQELGFWSTGDAEHALRHELGHAIQHIYADHDEAIRDKISALRNQVASECGVTLWNLEEKRETRLRAGEILSYYGLRNDGEFIAESIAEYMSGNPRDTAKKVVDILLGRD